VPQASDSPHNSRPGGATATGSNWEYMGPVLGGGTVFALASSIPCGEGGAVMAGTAVGVFVSGDGGRSWMLSTGEVGLYSAACVVLSPDFPRDPTVLAGGGPGGVLRSVDGGRSWRSVPLDIPDARIVAMAVSPAFTEDGFVLAGALEDGIYRSIDGGRHWRSADFGLMELQVSSLAVSPAWATDQTALAVAGRTLYRTTNGALAWKPVGGLPGEVIPQVVAFSPDFARDGVILVGTLGDGVWLSSDRGKDWNPARGTAGMDINCLLCSGSSKADDPLVIFAGTGGAGVLRSEDRGATWGYLGGPEDGVVLSVAPTYSPLGVDLLAGVAGHGIYRKRVADGQEWTWASEDLPAQQVFVLSSPNGAGLSGPVFAGGAPGLLLRKMDGVWQSLESGLFGEAQVGCIAPAPDYMQTGLILAAAGGQILRSSDCGDNWERVYGARDGEIRSLAFSPTFSEDHLAWACTGQELMVSRDAGGSWRSLARSFANQELSSIVPASDYASSRTIFLTTREPRKVGWTHRVWRSASLGADRTLIWEHDAISSWMVCLTPRVSGGVSGEVGSLTLAVDAEIFLRAGGDDPGWMCNKLPAGDAQILSLLVVANPGGGRSWLLGTTDGLFVMNTETETPKMMEGGPGRQPILALVPSTQRGQTRSALVLSIGGALWTYWLVQ